MNNLDMYTNLIESDSELDLAGEDFVMTRNKYLSDIIRAAHTVSRLNKKNESSEEQKVVIINNIKHLCLLYKNNPAFADKEIAWLYFSIFLHNADFFAMARLTSDKALAQIKTIFMGK